MALIYALLAPLFQLAKITVMINPYAKADKRGVHGRYFPHLGQAEIKGRKGNCEHGSCYICFIPLLTIISVFQRCWYKSSLNISLGLRQSIAKPFNQNQWQYHGQIWYNHNLWVHCTTLLIHLRKPQKNYFFSGPATKALRPTPPPPRA